MPIRILDHDEASDLLAFVELLDRSFIPPLSTRVNIEQWVRKALNLGLVLASGERHDLNGVIVFYCNDKKSFQAFIVYLAVASKARRRNVATLLIKEAIRICMREGMKSVLVGTETANTAALNLYKKFGFTEEDTTESEQSGRVVLHRPLLEESHVVED